MARVPFRQQILRVREEAIVASVGRLLAQKGFDLMTVDEVAADVGIAKASLYKHFASKEALAAAAMVRLLEQGRARLDALAADATLSAAERLRAVARWCLERQLAGEMPALPAPISSLRAELIGSMAFMDLLMRCCETLREWIVAAQQQGTIDAALPSELVLGSILALAFDPVPVLLRNGGRLADERIVELVLASRFGGLAAR